MFRLLADENFNDEIVRGVLLRSQELDFVCVRDVGLSGAGDPEILAWAAENNRIILTHDRATMPDFAYDRVLAGDVMCGVFIINARFPVASAIQEILLMAACSEQSEWIGRAIHLPLR
jgi:predicted nuclease of predicted toxin-antitoxin system